MENAKILIANTPMDTDKIKVFGSRVRVESVAKVAELEVAEKEKMAEKVRREAEINSLPYITIIVKQLKILSSFNYQPTDSHCGIPWHGG